MAEREMENRNDGMQTVAAVSVEDRRTAQLTYQAARPGNEAGRVSRWRGGLKMLGLILLGMAGAAAYPPLDWSWVGWLMLIPLMLAAWTATSWRQAWRYGFYWGYGFSFCAFFWLREIDPSVPWLLALVLALFPACWAAPVPWLRWTLTLPQTVRLKGETAVRAALERPLKWYWELALLAVLAAWWCVWEWVRSWVGTGLPWNDLAASQWRNTVLVQIIEYTGVYGVSFLVALVNLALALTLFNLHYGVKTGRLPRPVNLLVALGLVVAVLAVGLRLADRAVIRPASGKTITLTAAVLQGNISQRRNADERRSQEALDKYLALTDQAAVVRPDLIVWPETAIPDPYWAVGPVSGRYREGVTRRLQQYRIPMLIGTIDFAPPAVLGQRMDIVNSALLFDVSGRVAGKYSKMHIVPFGEFIPFRAWLPGPVIRMLDMGRDLSRGRSCQPLELHSGVWGGINICFEDVFDYIARREAQLGANLLLVITNDAWYPTSSEPEQHLANSVFRAIETRLPMMRCGNNSASCVIRPDGVIAETVFQTPSGKPDYRRHGEGIGLFTVTVPVDPPMTFFTRFGNLFVLACGLIVALAGLLALWQWRLDCRKLREAFE